MNGKYQDYVNNNNTFVNDSILDVVSKKKK